MAFQTVVGSFEIASSIGTFLGLGQNHMSSNENSCRITASLSESKNNLLHALDDLIKFAEILTEDESKSMREKCSIVSTELRKCRKIPIPKKKLKYYRKNPEYTKQLNRVRALAETSADLTVTVKETSSEAAFRNALQNQLERQDQRAREAKRNFLEDIIFYEALQQIVSSNDSHNIPGSKGDMVQTLSRQSANEHAQEPREQDPFLDEVSVSWAEHKPLRN